MYRPNPIPEFRPTGIKEVETDVMRERKAHRAVLYFRGPVFLADIHTAVKSGGPCLALLLAIHHRATITRQDVVTLPSGFLSDFGIDKSAKMARPKIAREGKAHHRRAQAWEFRAS
jgi:hypothetical protein